MKAASSLVLSLTKVLHALSRELNVKWKIYLILADVTHTGMKRRIENPRIICLDCTLEYKKGESATEVQLERQGDFEKLLEIEEEFIRRMCYDILKFKPDIVITEKGCSDLAQHFFVKNGVTALRRFKKTDNNRIARACGATIVNRPEDLQESFVGTKCGLFEVRKVFT
jgi:T-complex protein 1 subunit gamma